MTFGEKCKKYRTIRHLTQTAAAEAAGISKRTYIYYEQGQKMPRKRETAEKLADLFGVDINELIMIDDAKWEELQRKRPFEDRSKSLLKEIEELLSEETVSTADKLTFIQAISAFCQEYQTSLQPSSEDKSENDAT